MKYLAKFIDKTKAQIYAKSHNGVVKEVTTAYSLKKYGYGQKGSLPVTTYYVYPSKSRPIKKVRYFPKKMVISELETLQTHTPEEIGQMVDVPYHTEGLAEKIAWNEFINALIKFDLTTGDIRRLNDFSFEVINPEITVSDNLTMEQFNDRLNYRTFTKGDTFSLEGGYKFKVIS